MILRQQIIPTCINNIYPSRDLNVVGQLTFADNIYTQAKSTCNEHDGYIKIFEPLICLIINLFIY